ncbi:hypothetical protein Trydic_g5792 [Trypoxylus dichotomus]
MGVEVGIYRRSSKKHIHPSHADKSQDSENSEGTAYLPFTHGVTERIGRILRKQNIKGRRISSIRDLETAPASRGPGLQELYLTSRLGRRRSASYINPVLSDTRQPVEQSKHKHSSSISLLVPLQSEKIRKGKEMNRNLSTVGGSHIDMEEIFADNSDEPFLRELTQKIMVVYQHRFGEKSELAEPNSQKGIRRGA